MRLPPLLPGLLLLASLSGCLTAPPRHQVAASQGMVRGDSISQAQRVAELLDEMVPRVRDLLPDTRSEPLEVWVQRKLSLYDHWDVGEDVPAFTVEGHGRIHIVESGPRQLSAALAHELVHALLGDGWSSLPAVAEEGLADWVQEQLHPELADSLRADHLAKASAAFGGLRFGLWTPGSMGARQLAAFSFPAGAGLEDTISDPAAAIDDGGRSARPFWQPYEVSVSDPRLYGIGYVAVVRAIERVGPAGLLDLCRGAGRRGETLTAAELLAAGELSADPLHWQQVIRDRVGRGELRALGHTLMPFLQELLAGGSGDRRSLYRALARHRPRLGLEGQRTRISLGELRSLYERHVPETGAGGGPLVASSRPAVEVE